MSIGNAVVLGLVQGIAEFLPISSSGHLALLNNLFHMSSTEDGHLLFDVLLHLGTLISICVVYWSDIIEMAIIRISGGMKDKEIGAKDFKSPDSITSLVKSVKKQVKVRLEEIANEDDKDKISVDEVLAYIDERQCDRNAIMQVANELLAFSRTRSKGRSQNPAGKESAEHLVENMSTRSILTLRKKMKEEGFIGGGRY